MRIPLCRCGNRTMHNMLSLTRSKQGCFKTREMSKVQISNANDYVAPSQGCTASLKGYNKTTKKERSEKTVNTDPLKLSSLHDCLACSGCITSAETVMHVKQSVDEFLPSIKSGKAVIISLSPQSRASLAAHFGLSPSQVFRKLTTFFKSLGVMAVYDTSCSRDLVLIESCNEFITRYKQQILANKSPKPSLPMLSSSCPSWIRYAEKTSNSYILPYISSVKSPQQTIGSIIKHHVCQKMGLRLENIYHVTIMPCYDKKLEAARDEFMFSEEVRVELASEVGNLRFSEVDSVLTSREVLDLIRLKSLDFKNLEESPLDRLLSNVDDGGNLYGVSGSSGGYAETIFRHAAKTLFGREIEGPLNFKKSENSDFPEETLDVDGKIVLKFGLCYDFQKNLNKIKKIKIGKCDYHFLEVMAYPSGCLNGGGQIKPKEGQSAKDLLQSIGSVYMEDQVLVADPSENPQVRSGLNSLVQRKRRSMLTPSTILR